MSHFAQHLVSAAAEGTTSGVSGSLIYLIAALVFVGVLGIWVSTSSNDRNSPGDFVVATLSSIFLAAAAAIFVWQVQL